MATTGLTAKFDNDQFFPYTVVNKNLNVYQQKIYE